MQLFPEKIKIQKNKNSFTSLLPNVILLTTFKDVFPQIMNYERDYELCGYERDFCLPFANFHPLFCYKALEGVGLMVNGSVLWLAIKKLYLCQ